MMEKLLPCPFCGADDFEVVKKDAWFSVGCINCGARGPEIYVKNPSEITDVTERMFLETWNKRATDEN